VLAMDLSDAYAVLGCGRTGVSSCAAEGVRGRNWGARVAAGVVVAMGFRAHRRHHHRRHSSPVVNAMVIFYLGTDALAAAVEFIKQFREPEALREAKALQARTGPSP